MTNVRFHGFYEKAPNTEVDLAKTPSFASFYRMALFPSSVANFFQHSLSLF